jgi:2-keto-4-pentenoate hydratase/2-oxohepta-3-ene-1,7-dioic acid hydratase in catechol pathway
MEVGMRLVSYWHAGGLLPGFESGGVVVPARAVHDFGDRPVSVKGLLEAGSGALAEAVGRARRAVESREPLLEPDGELLLGPPVPDPDKIICLGQNYPQHIAEMQRPRPVVPNLFPKFRNSLVGPTGAIRLPRNSQQVDYEGELAVVIGRRCSKASEADALSYVAGYCVFNDVSARDLHNRTQQNTAGKALDTFAPMGPGITLAEEVGDPQTLRISTFVNGERVQDGNTDQMIFSVAATISFISENITLEPGDVIATGTPAGVGYKRNPPSFLRAGDMVEVEISRVGRIANPVIAG